MRVSKATCSVAALTGLLLAAPAADASSVRITGSQLRYVGAGEANRVQISRAPSGEYTIIDPSVRVRAAAGCQSTGRNTAVCSGDVTRVTVVGAGGGDRLSATFLEVAATLDGGEGADILTGGGADDLLDGDDGADTLIGQGGRDEMRGDDENDRLIGGPGPDIVDGGTGMDTAQYTDATGPLAIDLDGNADDGQAGEGDRVEADVDRILGGAFDDRIVAISGDHAFVGGPGNDDLVGGSGRDQLLGGDGDDRVNGGVGSDVLHGDEGNDTADYAGRFDPVDLDLRAGIALTDRGSGTRRVRETDNLFSFEAARGSSHADTLRGGPGPNVLVGGRGNDVLDGGASGDVMVGGGGRDRVEYLLRRAPVRASLDNVANDGRGGENDFIDDSVEDLAGGARGDVLFGNDRRNRLSGGGGRDELRGLGGADTLDGGDGADRLIGGTGGDAITGGPGLDSISGEDGDDRLDSRDGRRDGLLCGGGDDTVFTDRIDRVTSDCEHERR